MVNLFC